MKYKKYPTYKDSGVEWLGEIPIDWDKLYGKRLFKNRRQTSIMDDDQLAVTQKYGVIPQKIYMKEEGQKVVLALKGTDNFKHVEENDYVISLRSFQGGIEYSNFKGCVSPAYTVLYNTKQIEYQYYKLLFKSQPYILALQASTDSLREGKSITYDQFGTIFLPIPPIQEQQQIAKFLDNATQKMDTLIQKQENLIKLLKEKRQAVISHAVTRGLNPDVKFKDSGVEWLGDVPEHWKVLKLSYAFNTIGSGTTPTSNNESYYNGNIPWVTTGELRENTIIHTKKMLTNKAIVENTSLKLFPEDSIIIAMYGATIGRLAKLGIKATTNQACCVINNSRTIINNYLYYWLMGYRQEIINLGYGGGQPNISQDTISNLKISVTSIPEQKEIVKYLDDKTSKIDKLIKKATKSIKLLKEKRTALISAAVTGKIDVRELL